MHHEVTTWQIILNVLIQVINILIFFWVFKYFFADAIVNAIEERRKLINKLKNAEQEYKMMIEKAEGEKKQIIEEALQHKNQIIEEARALALKEKEKIIEEAKRKAKEIVDNAKAEWEKLKKQLEETWEESLKYTTKLVVRKLFNEDKDLKEEYLKKLIEEFKK